MHVDVSVLCCVIGAVTTVAGSIVKDGNGMWLDGVGTVARFNYPNGVSVDSAGNAWIADTYNHMIRKINATTGRGPSIVLCSLREGLVILFLP